ncbi:tetratricopeptide repeat protein [Qipengyuania atrilutea]|uniref:TolA-binding protein n=1 Tax=Qipengyuania atrilutea TaxID=2744473 RepID=A0A850H703_9SPHN|nr:hypothetical protein [Actirhodobacter atriluteus]NVD44975.1 hypothetical protein [Actirhodobacter atriluteus]
MTTRTFRMAIASGIAASLLASPVPAFAQENADARLRKVEREIRALQRRVFPGADGKFFEPEISPSQAQTGQPAVAAPSTSALTDVLSRLDALERQIQRITAQTETNDNMLREMSGRLEALEARPVAPAVAELPREGAIQGNLPQTGQAAAAPAQASTGGSVSPARLAAVQAITKPSTGDAADDEYVYGFRLWDAGFFPEAQQQLTSYVQANPNHSRISFGRNLLGRAYLDDNKPKQAAPWFLENYQADKQGARAADSLLYLAEAMISSNDTERACIALAEFGDTYPALASGRLQSQYEANRRKVSCN